MTYILWIICSIPWTKQLLGRGPMLDSAANHRVFLSSFGSIRPMKPWYISFLLHIPALVSPWFWHTLMDPPTHSWVPMHWQCTGLYVFWEIFSNIDRGDICRSWALGSEFWEFSGHDYCNGKVLCVVLFHAQHLLCLCIVQRSAGGQNLQVIPS